MYYSLISNMKLKENILNTSYASNTLNIWIRIPFILFKSGQFIKSEKLHKLLYKPLLKRKKMYHKMAQVCGIWVTIYYFNLFFCTTYIYVWQTYLLSLVKWLTKFACVVCLFFFIDFEQKEIYDIKGRKKIFTWLTILSLVFLLITFASIWLRLSGLIKYYSTSTCNLLTDSNTLQNVNKLVGLSCKGQSRSCKRCFHT